MIIQLFHLNVVLFASKIQSIHDILEIQSI